MAAISPGRFLANVNVRYMSSQFRLSVVCLSVTLVRPTQPVKIFGNCFHHTIAQGLYFSGAKNRWWGTISLFVPVKFNFCRKKSATKFLCMKTSSGKVVATSFPYPKVHRSIAGYVPVYLKLAFKLTHPFRKRRFPKLLFNRA